MIKNFTLIFILAGILASGCQLVPGSSGMADAAGMSIPEKRYGQEETVSPFDGEPITKPASADVILARPQVPILCYHQIRDWRPGDSKQARDYIVPVNRFKAQLKMLADSGYHSISPGQLYDYLVYGRSLPPKPVMISFDDSCIGQYTIARPELERYGFKGLFFIMTVAIGRPNYMSSKHIKQLADGGHTIGSHTWDHHTVKKYEAGDWINQIDKPTQRLKEITGKDVKYFAYPFGLWNRQAIPELAKRGYSAAFTLSEKRDEQQPVYTIRRIIASGYWDAERLHNSMLTGF